jgi:hypothetical protein
MGVFFGLPVSRFTILTIWYDNFWRWLTCLLVW